MQILIDTDIKKLHQPKGEEWEGMITPFVPTQIKTENGKRIVSYGLSSCGYDIRLGTQFKRPFVEGKILDPLTSDEIEWYEFHSKSTLILPGQMILGVSLEKFKMPEDTMALCLGKSTWARLALFVNVTPLEPGWEGTLTMELSNIGHHPIRVHAGMGIAQLVFFKGKRPMTTYADRQGKYQGQVEVTTARL